MPQRTLPVVSPYGKSGSVLLLNPTDRQLEDDYTIPGYSAQAGESAARIARKPSTIRGTPPTYVAGAAASTLTFTSMSPNTVARGGADITVNFIGTGFTTSTYIIWNGSPEVTTYVSATSVTTVVKPSLVANPITIQATVAKPGEVPAATRPFTFT